MRPLVVIPTYNEVDNIVPVMGRVLEAEPQAHILVVDDGSPDGTGDLVSRRADTDPRVHVLRRAAKTGLGAAYRAGFAWGLDRGYDVLVEMDADLSHPPERLPALLAALSHADVAIGSRYVPGGTTVGWPWSRQVISRVGNGYVSLALRLGVRDATAGFRAYRREVLEAVEVDLLRSNGYCFQIEMAERTGQAGFRVAEIPITFTERVAGQSKMSSAIVVEALWLVTKWGVRHRLSGSRPRPQRQRLAFDLTVIGGQPSVGAS